MICRYCNEQVNLICEARYWICPECSHPYLSSKGEE